MAPSQPQHASEDEDHEILDCPETHNSDCGSITTEDDPDYIDAERAGRNGSATDSENSPGDHDTEPIPGVEDPSYDNTLASLEDLDFYPTKDLVDSDLEEDDVDLDDQNNDNLGDQDNRSEDNGCGELHVSKLPISDPFCPSTTDLDQEPDNVCLNRFRQKLHSIFDFLAKEARETAAGESNHVWVCREFTQPLEKFTPAELVEIFEEVIPEATRIMLGSAKLTPEIILALPEVDSSVALPGVYLIAFLKGLDMLPQVSEDPIDESEDPMDESEDPMDESDDRMDESENPTDEQPKVPSGLYGGSSLKSISDRCVDHGKMFRRVCKRKLIDGRWISSSTRVMYVYCYANTHRLVPAYRQVCVFPKHLQSFDDLTRTEINCLVRLLEQAMILLLDIYEPCDNPKLRETIGYSETMYLEALEQCGIPLSSFHPLNHAMPLKQSNLNVKTVGRRVCHHCGSITSGANAWYLHPDATEDKPLYYCSACYVYKSLHQADRPAALFNGVRARPTAGPCSNCQTTESVTWDWDPRDKVHVLCSPCRSYWSTNRADRPMKRAKKCTKCGATDTKGHWHCAYDANGQKTGDDWCSVCAMQNKRDIDKEAKKNNYANCTCSVCGGSNLPASAWKTASICLSCWEERNSDDYFKKQRDRSDCWHCHRRFKKQNNNPLSDKEWRSTRHWHPLLKEWICSLCHVKGRDGGSFGITVSHLEDLEIRCEDCNTLYAAIWNTMGQKLLDRLQDSTLTRDRITCGNCYQLRYKSSLKKAHGKDKTGALVFANKHNYPRMPKGLTWQEWAGKDLGDEPYPQTKLLLPYLLRVHGMDFSNEKIIADKVVENDWELDDLELDAMDSSDDE